MIAAPCGIRPVSGHAVLVAMATQPTEPNRRDKIPTHITSAGDPARAAAILHRAGVMPLNQAMNDRESGGPRRTQKPWRLPSRQRVLGRPTRGLPPSSSLGRTSRMETPNCSKATVVTANDGKGVLGEEPGDPHNDCLKSSSHRAKVRRGLGVRVSLVGGSRRCTFWKSDRRHASTLCLGHCCARSVRRCRTGGIHGPEERGKRSMEGAMRK